MKVKADLHIHSVLSPCADLSMSLSAIAARARKKGLNFISVTDHNSLLNSIEALKLSDKNLLIIPGAEIQTAEDIHILCYFPAKDEALAFQDIIEENMIYLKHNHDKFGDQVAVDIKGNILKRVDYTLMGSLKLTVNDLFQKVKGLNGVCIPAHYDKPSFSIISQLGFVPPELNIKTVEYFKNPLKGADNLRFSDSHFLYSIGGNFFEADWERLNFEEFRRFVLKK